VRVLADFTLIDFCCCLSLSLIVDLGRLTVGQIDINRLTLVLNLGAGSSILGKGKWRLTGEALVSGTDCTLSGDTGAFKALHSLGESSSCGGNL